MKLYNTTVRVVAQIRASSPEEARRLLMMSMVVADDAEFLPMEKDDVFISDVDPLSGWDGERFEDES